MGLAIIGISYTMFQHLPCSHQEGEGRFEGDIWIEPERRYNLRMIRTAINLPEWWQPPKNCTRPVVWDDPSRGCICLLVEGNDIPETEDGQWLPFVSPIFRNDYDPETGKYLSTTYLGLDTSSLKVSNE